MTRCSPSGAFQCFRDVCDALTNVRSHSPAGKKHLAVALTDSGNLTLADASDNDEYVVTPTPVVAGD